MIKSVVRENKWTPKLIDGLYLDDADHFGLYYWYLDVKEVSQSLKSKDTSGKLNDENPFK